jgi:glucan-binding YG repeat protein
MVKKEWQTVDGKKYYFKSDGSAATLSTKISGKYYIFSKKGVLYSPKSTSVVTIGKVKYQVKSNGIAASGWSKDKTYYFDKTGKRITGIQVIKGKFYSFASSGKINSSKTKKLQKAAKYEKNIATLRKLLGKPSKVRYYSSCYGDGKDGVWKYKNFTVYTFKPRKGKEIFMGVE